MRLHQNLPRDGGPVLLGAGLTVLVLLARRVAHAVLSALIFAEAAYIISDSDIMSLVRRIGRGAIREAEM